MIVSGYTLHLYCDDDGHPWDTTPGALTEPGEFSGRTGAIAMSEARAVGWRFYREGGEMKCRCPECDRRRSAKHRDFKEEPPKR